jgi:glucose/mannose transport system substrate-binding protein
MRSRGLFLTLAAILASLAFLAACGGDDDEGGGGGEAVEGGKLEIFSWWTAGGEADGLEEFFRVYRQQNASVDVVNAAVAGGAGANAKAVLKNRMLGGDPPDSFQVHGGQELLDTWVKPGKMEPITDLWEDEGWKDVYPEQLVEMVTQDDEIYSVPANVHRGNVLWYNKKLFDANDLQAPKTFDDFFAAAEKLKAEGIPALALGDKLKWEAAHLFEDVLLGSLGPDGYRGLWNGETAWDGPEVTEAFATFDKMLDHVNKDHAAHTWDSATQMVLDGKAGMTVMGDWAHGYFLSKKAKPETDYAWAPAPGTEGSFMVVTDTFGLPKDAPDPDQADAWLRVVGSKEGQEAFNPKKGSICARTDCDMSVFDVYLKSSAQDFKANELTPSEAHGSAAPEGFATEFNDIISGFVTNRDADAAMSALKQACIDNGMCTA